ncbi:MAG: 16S rRNA (cytidine(1402)-2'-O)-methyltransferase [Chloroflexi bacterium]|nr:MAG: 16S rRNA (cytidine(1402)-2'-O)-methyltransferase [Chloroflexota bacterium]
MQRLHGHRRRFHRPLLQGLRAGLLPRRRRDRRDARLQRLRADHGPRQPALRLPSRPVHRGPQPRRHGRGEPAPAGRRSLRVSTLFVVGTPIGNLEDVTRRAERVLGEVSAIAAEDTRVTARLLARLGVRKPLLSYRAPVERRGLPAVLRALEEGDVALVTDAGTPGVNDPGQRLVAAALAAGHEVVPVPGPSAVATALSVSGFSGDGFVFVGYLPRRPGELRRLFASLESERRPAVAFESPYRVLKSLAILAEVLPDRPLAVGRELTKLHEEVLRGTAAEVLEAMAGKARGEFTLVIAGCPS